MFELLKSKFYFSFQSQRRIAPLVVLRIIFGLLMFFSTLRFLWKGWVKDFYITPHFHFTFYGFDWVRPFGEHGMYLLFTLMLVSSLCIALGLFYRISSVLFFLTFTYVELIDKTYYLNHYYFISLIAFLMTLVPANRCFSLDVLRNPDKEVTQVPAWTITIFKLQLLIVYLFAGISKINSDWLFEAMPLKIWLPANAHLSLIGPLLEKEVTAYVFSWFGMLFDIFIVFFLLNNSTRTVAYFFVILFHVFTAWFFKIGMFPFVMMSMTLIFFSESFHSKIIQQLRRFLGRGLTSREPKQNLDFKIYSPLRKKIICSILIVYFIFQIIIPFRYLLYPGKLLWTEEGYRFSWRVMLMEKSGTPFFHVKDPETGRSTEVNNRNFLTAFQEKMMCTQPDMILQYAHYLKNEYKKKGIEDPIVTVEDYISLNGKGSRLYIDTAVDLAGEIETLAAKKWILPYNENELSK